MKDITEIAIVNDRGEIFKVGSVITVTLGDPEQYIDMISSKKLDSDSVFIGILEIIEDECIVVDCSEEFRSRLIEIPLSSVDHIFLGNEPLMKKFKDDGFDMGCTDKDERLY